MKYLLISILSFYVVYTLLFAIKFNKTDTYFSAGQKLIHNLGIGSFLFFGYSC